MKKHFIKYLIEDLGFKTFRKIGDNYVPNTILDYSTMQDGGVDVRLIKDDKEIVWGLHEYGKPPTLIYPRPKITVITDKYTFFERSDDAINICLREEDPEDIFKALYDNIISFKYDKRTKINGTNKNS